MFVAKAYRGIFSHIGIALVFAAGLLTGCSSGIQSAAVALHTGLGGSIHGGLSPVTSSAVYLYAASAGGSASPSVSLLRASSGTTLDAKGSYYATSDANGLFNFTPGGVNAFTCAAGEQLYVLSVGGDSGSGVNASLILSAAVGDCSTLSTSAFIGVNEVSTVAAAYALNNIALTPTQITACGSQNPCDLPFATSGMSVAFANVSNLVDLASGSALSNTPAGGGVVPQSTINTLADVLSTCVNSNGKMSATALNGGPTPCYSLFNLAKTSAGVVPTDTFTAMLNIARNFTQNVSGLFQLVSSTMPFQPTLSSAPANWGINVIYPTTLQFTQGVNRYNENAGTVMLQVSRTGSPSGVASVAYSVVGGGTAVKGTDFTVQGSSLSWTAGDTSTKTITLQVSDEQLTSGFKYFTLQLSSLVGASIGTQGTSVVSIIDNDPAQVVASCQSYSNSADANLCQVNSAAAPNAIAVRVSPSPSAPNQPIVVKPTAGSALTEYFSAITTKYFNPVSYQWSQVTPTINGYATSGTATFFATTTSGPQVFATLTQSGVYQFQVIATDANNKSISNYFWVNVWDNVPALAPGSIGRYPGILPPPSVQMLSADPGALQHPRLLFSAGDWPALTASTNSNTGTPEVLAGLVDVKSGIAGAFDKTGSTMYALETALTQYANDSYAASDYNNIASTYGLVGSVPTVPTIFQATPMASTPSSNFADALAAASYTAWLAVDPTQPLTPGSATTVRLQYLATLTAAYSQFWLVTELAYPASFTGTASQNYGVYSLALAYDLTFNAMTAAQQTATRDYLYTIGNVYNGGGGGVRLTAPATNPSSSGQNGVDFPNLADGIIFPALVIEGEEPLVSPSILNNTTTFGTYNSAASSTDPAVTAADSWPYASQTSVRNMGREVRANSEYILGPWGFYHSMTAYFHLGQNITAPMEYAFARRGENQWVTTNLYQALLHPLYTMSPADLGDPQVSLDFHDGAGYAGGSAERNFYYISKAMYPDDAMVDYVYRQATSGQNKTPLTRVIFGQRLQTQSMQTMAQAKGLGLTKYDPLMGFMISKNGWSENDLSMVMNNFTLGGGHYHAQANSFSLSALGRTWSNSPQYHIVPNDAQQTVLIQTDSSTTTYANQGYTGQGPSSADEFNNYQNQGPFHGAILQVSYDPKGQWTWFAGDSAPAYNFWAYSNSKQGTPVSTGLTNSYMLPAGLTSVLIPSDATNLNTSTQFASALPHNTVQYAFRSIMTVLGTYPYVLVIDDINRNGSPQNYRWVMNNSIGFGSSSNLFLDATGKTSYASLEIQTGATATDATLYHSLDSGTAAGLPRLLVRDVTGQSTTGQPAIFIDDRPIPSGGGTPQTNLTYGLDNNSHLFTFFPSRRLMIERDAVVEPKYKVLLFPFLTGGLVPVTAWNAATSTLTVTVGTQVDTITFDETNSDHRTRLGSFSRH